MKLYYLLRVRWQKTECMPDKDINEKMMRLEKTVESEFDKQGKTLRA